MVERSQVHIVDDDQSARKSLRYLLEADGLRVIDYPSAADFLDSFVHDCPSCVVLDLRMPDMDGLQLQAELCARGSCPSIIFVSGCGDIRRCVTAMKEGAIDFLEKPVDHQAISAAVQAALAKDAARFRKRLDSRKVKLRIDLLTPREHEVMRLMYEGKSIKGMASSFGISFQTVSKHRVRVLEKLQVENEAELARLLANLERIEAAAS